MDRFICASQEVDFSILGATTNQPANPIAYTFSGTGSVTGSSQTPALGTPGLFSVPGSTWASGPQSVSVSLCTEVGTSSFCAPTFTWSIAVNGGC
ncbi:MAG TPA: hypothetical protein VMK42_01035 [Anaeromyxobacteraceae bacterium]|nr:hypothetical protein [Anaeromyxobacteraceae bacterium]